VKQQESYLIPVERIANAILELRGERVMFDADLAALYGIETKALVRAVKRNAGRFPTGFMFQLTKEEFDGLRCHFGTSKGSGGRRHLPYAFTEHGAVMLAAVLKSERAVEVSVFVVKAFVRMRRMLTDQRQLALRLTELESKLSSHDKNFQAVFDALRRLMQTPEPKKRRIGFVTTDRQGETGSDFIARDRPTRSRRRG
jgi:hypothetical protein